LWKSVQITGLRAGAEELGKLRVDGSVNSKGIQQMNSVRACSACSGDYEDPEETAWTEEGEEDAGEADAGEADAENAKQPEARERFPVR
jgi:hypothetical protein